MLCSIGANRFPDLIGLGIDVNRESSPSRCRAKVTRRAPSVHHTGCRRQWNARGCRGIAYRTVHASERASECAMRAKFKASALRRVSYRGLTKSSLCPKCRAAHRGGTQRGHSRSLRPHGRSWCQFAWPCAELASGRHFWHTDGRRCCCCYLALDEREREGERERWQPRETERCQRTPACTEIASEMYAALGVIREAKPKITCAIV